MIRGGGVEVAVAKTSRRLALAEIANMLDDGTSSASLSAGRSFRVRREPWSFGLVAALARGEDEKGTVTFERLILSYELGRATDPVLVEGQLQGEAVQALGGTLLEHIVYDEVGNLITTSFMGYLVPTSTDAPRITVFATEGGVRDGGR